MPELSIITINLNNKDGLETTIKSVVEQTYNDFEYIVIDGNSNDGSKDVILKYSDKITIWRSEADTGIYNAMNKGIKLAKGKYCLFLNSGDYLYSQGILSNVFNQDITWDIEYGNMIIEDENHEKSLGEMPDEITLEQMIKDTLWHPVSFIKRDLFEKYGYYREDLKIVSDYDFFLKNIIINKVTTRHISIPIAVFALGGMSSMLKNVQLLKSEREKVQLQYFDKNLLDEIKSKLAAQNGGDKVKISLFDKIKRWFR